MKRFSLVAALIAMMAAMPALAETRIGVVDLRQALFSSNKAQAFSENLKEEFSGEEAKLREAGQAAQAVKDRLDADGAMMNESERRKLAQELRQKAQQFQLMRQQFDQAVAARKQEFLEQSSPTVDAAVQELLDENDLDIILPKEAVVFAKPEMDLTEELLNKLNQ